MPVAPGLDEIPGHLGGVPVVGVALLDNLRTPRRLLSCRRVAPPSLAGCWELPGGKVEVGESWRAALHRELAEELSVLVRIGSAVPGPNPDGTWPLPNRHRMAVWLAQARGGLPRIGADHDELRWLTRADLHSVAWLPADGPIVAAIGAHLAGSDG